MSNVNSDLIKILSDHIKNNNSSIVASRELITLADSHQVTPILYYQTKDEALRGIYLQAVSTYTQRKALMKQISEAFNDIPFYTVKGIAISEYYPVPQLRTMGDCDIIVHEKDKERAREALLSIGFKETTGKWDDMEWHFQKQGMDFELHHRLLYDEMVNTECEKKFTDSAWNYENNHELDVDYHFAFVLIHLKKHLLNRGVGIRQFMDLAVMGQNAKLNNDRIAGFINQVGLTKFASVCAALCFRWFDVVLPIERFEITDEFFVGITEKIMANGVFGFEVADNENKKMLNAIKRDGKKGSIMEHLFPSYYSCCITPKYKWIKGKPFLLPILWLYRIVWAVFSGKRRHSMDYLSAIANSDKALTERNNILEKWGL